MAGKAAGWVLLLTGVDAGTWAGEGAFAGSAAGVPPIATWMILRARSAACGLVDVNPF